MKVCVVGASGKLGRYMVQQALARGYDVVGVCREQSVAKLDEFRDRIAIVPGATNDPDVIGRAVADCDGVLTVLVPWGVQQYATGTAQAVLDHARPGARLVFSCGWHITRDGRDVYSWRLKWFVNIFGRLAKLMRFADLDDQVEACRRVFASDTRWTVVRGSDLEEGDSQGLPVWRRHVGDPALASNITRRVDFALFMVAALDDDTLVHEAPAIVSCRAPSALAHAAAGATGRDPTRVGEPAAAEHFRPVATSPAVPANARLSLLHDDADGLTIHLVAPDDGGATYQLRFPMRLAVRMTDEGDRLRSMDYLDGRAATPIGIVERSSWVAWFVAEGLEIRDADALVHWCIVTPDDIVDVIAMEAPEVCVCPADH